MGLVAKKHNFQVFYWCTGQFLQLINFGERVKTELGHHCNEGLN